MTNNALLYYEASDDSFSYGHRYDAIPMQSDFSLHTDKTYEIYCFLKGEGEFFIEGNRYALTQNDILIISYNELHMFKINNDLPYERIVIHIKKDFLPPFISSGVDLFRAFKARPLGQSNKIGSETSFEYELPNLYNKLEECCKKRNPEDELLAKCLVIQILITINGIFESHNVLGAMPKNHKIGEIIEYVNASLSESLTLEEISERFYISKYHLCHAFKEETGFSIKKYIAYKRILKADELMINGYSPTQACFECGFNDYSVFYRSYRALTGKCPRQANI